MNDILGLIDDGPLTAALRRVAAAADRGLTETAAPPSRRAWSEAAVVVLDPPAAAAACAAELPRRPGVVLVCAETAGLDEWQAAATIGADRVLALPDDEVELLAIIASAAEPVKGGGSVLAVLGGCGGAGASTFAAALAWTCGRVANRDTMLVDTDPFGGGLDVLTGLEERGGVRWPGVTVDAGRVSARALREAVPTWAPGVGVLATERGHPEQLSPTAATTVVDAVQRAGTTVVCDVGRTFDPVAEAVIALADLAVVVVPARVGAALAAARIADRLMRSGTRGGLVVRGPAPGGLGAADLADVTGLEVVASMRPEPGLPEALERGGLQLRRRSPLAAAAREVLDAAGARDEGPRWVA